MTETYIMAFNLGNVRHVCLLVTCLGGGGKAVNDTQCIPDIFLRDRINDGFFGVFKENISEEKNDVILLKQSQRETKAPRARTCLLLSYHPIQFSLRKESL